MADSEDTVETTQSLHEDSTAINDAVPLQRSLLIVCKCFSLITAISAILCISVNLLVAVVSFKNRSGVFDAIFRIYAMAIAVVVVVAETEWSAFFKFWKVLEYWPGRGMLQIFVAVMTRAFPHYKGQRKDLALLQNIASYLLLSCGVVYLISVHKKRKLNRSEMLPKWDTPLLEILDGMDIDAKFSNGTWRLVASRMRQVVDDPLIKDLTAEDWKARAKQLRQMYNKSKKVPCPTPFEEKLRRVFSLKRVPTFSRKSANPISLSNISRTFSTGRSGSSLGSKSKSRRQWEAALVPALANLVSSHNMKIEIVDEVIGVLNTEMKAMVFLNLHPDNQKMEVMSTIGSRAFRPVESPLASTQLVEFTPSASNIGAFRPVESPLASTQLVEFTPSASNICSSYR